MYVLSKTGKCLRFEIDSNTYNEVFHLNRSINCYCHNGSYLIISFDTKLYIYNLETKRGCENEILYRLRKLCYIMDANEYVAVTILYKRLLTTFFFSLLIGLNEEGNLLYVSLDSFLSFCIDATKYSNLDLLNNNYLYLLNDNTINIREMTGFVLKYSFEIRGNVALIPSNSSNIYYVETFASEVIVNQIEEMSPMHYYQGYIIEKLYEEALLLADKFNLDKTLVIKAKLNDIVVEVECPLMNVKQFIDLLKDVDQMCRLQNTVEVLKKQHADVQSLKWLFEYIYGTIRNDVNQHTIYFAFKINNIVSGRVQ